MGGLGSDFENHEVSFRAAENVLNLILVMDAQLCEYVRNHRVVHFKWLNCKVCELYLNKAITKKKKRSFHFSLKDHTPNRKRTSCLVYTATVPMSKGHWAILLFAYVTLWVSMITLSSWSPFITEGLTKHRHRVNIRAPRFNALSSQMRTG